MAACISFELSNPIYIIGYVESFFLVYENFVAEFVNNDEMWAW